MRARGSMRSACCMQVLDKRFPRNSLLSHDLIEGAYTRAGLVTDIEIIDDYPSHYSAHMRRKHRWVRGDWQIAQWIFSLVPDEEGRMVENPISTISRWKIFDNLRRSLIEPVTFLLLVAGWFVSDRWAALLDGGDAGAAVAAGAGAAGLRSGPGAVEDECSGGSGWGDDAVELGWNDAAESGVSAAPHAAVAGCDLPLDGAAVHLGQVHAGVGDGGAGGGGRREEDAAGLVSAAVAGGARW